MSRIEISSRVRCYADSAIYNGVVECEVGDYLQIKADDGTYKTAHRKSCRKLRSKRRQIIKIKKMLLELGDLDIQVTRSVFKKLKAFDCKYVRLTLETI